MAMSGATGTGDCVHVDLLQALAEEDRDIRAAHSADGDTAIDLGDGSASLILSKVAPDQVSD
jgi:hypothetical protein